MSNNFYTHGSFPSTGSQATSASMRSELDLITAGFDKMPTLTANANKFVVINSGATALTATSTLPTATVTDTGFTVQNTTDNTKTFQFLASGITAGNLRIYTMPDADTTLVGTGVTQTLTNKTLTSPVIATIVNTGTLTLPTSTDTLVGRATTDTLTNKTLTAPVIATIVNTGTLTLPTSTDTLVGRATTDTLTNKTLTLPVIASIVNTGTLTLPTSTDTLVGRATTDTLTNKTLTLPVIASIVNTGTLTLPTSTDTLVGRATTDTLTNKTLTSPAINTGTISGGTINNAVIGGTTAAAGTFTALTDSGNLTFTGTGNRILGDTNNATISNRLFFQASTTNGSTSFGVLPNGTSLVSGYQAYNNSDPTNAAFAQLATSAGTEVRLTSGITGTGTYLPMTFYTGGSNRLQISTSGKVSIGGATNATVTLEVVGTDAILLPKGTTAEQPTGVAGYLRFNTTTTQFEGYNGTAWSSVGGAAISNDTSTSTNIYPVLAGATSGTALTVYTSNAKLLYKPSTGEFTSSVLTAGNGIVVNSQTVATSYTIAAGYSGMSAGPVTVASGQSVTISSGSRWVVQ